MRRRQINCLRHPMTSRQCLSMLLDFWQLSRNLPVVLITKKGQAAILVKLIRATLSKERQELRVRAAPVNYGFKCSEVFPFTDQGVKGEAIVVQWRLTKLQRMRNMRHELFGNLEDRINAN